MDEYILLILGIIGVISFSVSGTIVAIKAKFDLFGVIIMGCVTASGGGILRDVIIGKIPPELFSKPYVFAIAALASVIVFLSIYFDKKDFLKISETIERVNNVFDSVGLAAFTVTGTEMAFICGLSENVFLSITIGVLTGIGGGVLRDILTGTSPYVFRKHVYAVAAIFGGAIYYVLRCYVVVNWLASLISMIFIIGIRLLATKFRWELPKIDIR